MPFSIDSTGKHATGGVGLAVKTYASGVWGVRPVNFSARLLT